MQITSRLQAPLLLHLITFHLLTLNIEDQELNLRGPLGNRVRVTGPIFFFRRPISANPRLNFNPGFLNSFVQKPVWDDFLCSH